jgi:hypothetical protein
MNQLGILRELETHENAATLQPSIARNPTRAICQSPKYLIYMENMIREDLNAMRDEE